MSTGSGDPIGARAATEKYSEKECRPAPKNWQKQGGEFGELMTVNLLELSGSRLFWNKVAIDTQTLRRYLIEVQRLNPKPSVVLVVEPQVRCSEVLALRRLSSSNLQCGVEFACVEYSSRAWKSVQPPPLQSP
jgi:hypothetical protein